MPEFEPDTQVQTFRRLYLAQTPDSHARMNGPQADKKYTKVHQPISNHALAAHLAGHTTLAAPLVGPSGLTQHAALDIDHGGGEALHRVLTTAQAQGWTAYAITSTTEAHAGGHVWLHFDQPTAPERARHLADQLATAAGVDAETYPTRKALRLPLGVHRWTGQRGTLLFQDGRQLDLDTEANAGYGNDSCFQGPFDISSALLFFRAVKLR